jgi:hypothetical protein
VILVGANIFWRSGRYPIFMGSARWPARPIGNRPQVDNLPYIKRRVAVPVPADLDLAGRGWIQV